METIRCCTEITINGTLYCEHSDFKQGRLWNDWCMANILGGNDTHVKCGNTVCCTVTIVKRQDTDNVPGLHHNAPEHNVIVLGTSLVRHVEMPSASQLLLFKAYHPIKHHCAQATDVQGPVAVFFGSGCWIENDGKGAVTEPGAAKLQTNWQDAFYCVDNGNTQTGSEGHPAIL